MSKAFTALNYEPKPIRVGGHEYEVRKLGLKQIVQLSAFAAQFGQAAINKAKDAINDGKVDAVILAEAVGEAEMPRLLQILLNAPSLEDKDRLEAITMEEVSELVVAFTEVNDLNKIVANFQKAGANVGGLKKILGSLSRPSSDV